MTNQTSGLIKTITKTLTKLGQEVTFSRDVVTYDPDTATNLVSSTTSFTGYGSIQNYTQFDIANSNIDTNDAKLIISGATIAPLVDDRVQIGATAYRVMNVISYILSGISVGYLLQIRK